MGRDDEKITRVAAPAGGLEVGINALWSTGRIGLRPSLGSIALHCVRLAGDGQDPLPRAAAHVEAPRRVLDQLGYGDVHLRERG